MANEKRLIDAVALVTTLRKLFELLKKGEIEKIDLDLIIAAMPTEDAVEVVHGRWENITGGMITLGDCSECKVRQPVIGTNYCKNCGAKMDKNENP